MRAAAILAALFLAACSGPSPEPVPEDADEPAVEAPRDDIYVARYEAPPPGPNGNVTRLALFHGRWNVVNDCLVFDMGGDERSLVRFPVGTRVDVYSDRVELDHAVYRFAEQVTHGGGVDGENAHDLLVTPPPPECDYSVIGP